MIQKYLQGFWCIQPYYQEDGHTFLFLTHSLSVDFPSSAPLPQIQSEKKNYMWKGPLKHIYIDIAHAFGYKRENTVRFKNLQ